jgi:hypothetical protein
MEKTLNKAMILFKKKKRFETVLTICEKNNPTLLITGSAHTGSPVLGAPCKLLKLHVYYSSVRHSTISSPKIASCS